MEAAATRRLPLVALLIANAISLIGSQLTFIAIPWFVLQTTGSASKAGVAAFFAVSPALLASFFGGPLVDRWGYKRASVAADLGSGITVALVPLLHHTIGLAFWQLLVLTFLGGLLDAPGGLARESLTPDLAALAGTALERVNAANQALWRTSGLLGPPLAGALIAVVGPSRALILDAASFAISAALIALLAPSRRSPAPVNAPRHTPHYFAELREGMSYIWHDRLQPTLILSFTLLNALSEPLFRVILPVLARRTLGGAVDLGFLLAAFAGGGLIGTALFGALGHSLPRRALYVGSYLATAATMLPLLGPPSLLIDAFTLALRGVVSAPLTLLVLTATQERVPPHLRARVLGTGRAIALSAMPLGVVAAGYLIESIGVRGTIATIAVTLLVLALGLMASPALRELDRNVARS